MIFQTKTIKAMNPREKLFKEFLEFKINFISCFCDSLFTLTEEIIGRDTGIYPD